MDLTEAARILEQFCGPDLTYTLGGIEASAKGLTLKSCRAVLAACGARDEVLIAAGLVKKLAGQINVIIHASGILMCLPKILESDEVVQYLSRATHGSQYETVRDYYQARGTQVTLQDVSSWVNGLVAEGIDEVDPTEA